MPGGILNGFKSFVDKDVPKNLPIPGLANSNEEEEFSEFVPVEPFEENGSDISEDT